MRRTFALTLALALAPACADGGGDRPGNPVVYERIETLTDCGRLQAEFDTAMDNAEARPVGDPLRDASLGYADAADQRMAEIGCYD